MPNAKDILVEIEGLLLNRGKEVEWQITYDPVKKRYIITLENPSIEV